MNKRLTSWVSRLVLVCAISMAMIAPLPVVPTSSSFSTVSVAYAKASTKVYVTRTGKKYHRTNCRYLRQSKIKKTLSWAKSRRYGACKICRPPKK